MDPMSLYFGEAAGQAADSINPSGSVAHFVHLVANLLPAASESDRKKFLRDVVSRLAVDAEIKLDVEIIRRCAYRKCFNQFSASVRGRRRLYCCDSCRKRASRERLKVSLPGDKNGKKNTNN